MIPLVPNAWRASQNLDVEKLNDDLERVSRDIARSMDRRYTYSPPIIFELDGITDASAAVLRTFAMRRPNATTAVEVFFVELVLYGNAAVTATLTPSDTNIPALTVTTSATTTTEVYASIGVPVPIPSSTVDTTWALSFSAAYTVTRGYMVFHTRCDRGQQGDAFTGYAPTTYNAQTVRTAAALDTEMTNLENAVARDLAADKDVRVECYGVRNLLAATNFVYRSPSGARRLIGAHIYLVAAATVTADAELTGGINSVTVEVVGGGITVLAVNFLAAGADATQDNLPMTVASDLTVTITSTGGTSLMAYALVWWS